MSNLRLEIRRTINHLSHRVFEHCDGDVRGNNVDLVYIQYNKTEELKEMDFSTS